MVTVAGRLFVFRALLYQIVPAIAASTEPAWLHSDLDVVSVRVVVDLVDYLVLCAQASHLEKDMVPVPHTYVSTCAPIVARRRHA